MDTEDGQVFIKNLAYFVRTHEKALANALLLQRQNPRNAAQAPGGATSPTTSSSNASTFPLPYLNFGSQSMKPAKLTLTPHHLWYLLSRFEELGVSVGPMNVRLENIHTEASPTNYVSFLSQAQSKKSRQSDRDSIHSVSSMRSVVSSMSALWSSLGIGSNAAARIDKQKAATFEDIRYLYSAFTKVPCLRLAPDHKARMIAGYEEFPFDSAVPLHAFKTMSALEIYDIDFRQFYGWDRLAEQVKSLTLKRAGVEDPADLLIHIVLDDIDKRRKRSAKIPPSLAQPFPASPGPKRVGIARSGSVPSSPEPGAKNSGSPQSSPMKRGLSVESGSVLSSANASRHRRRSVSPRPISSRHGSNIHGRSTPNIRRASNSSANSSANSSTTNLLMLGHLPSNYWRFLRHLSLADNSLTYISALSLSPLVNTLHSLDLSSNLFNEIPESLSSLTSLKALNLSSCLISDLRTLGKNPLPAITVLNLRSNRLTSIAGIERLPSLERVDFRDNILRDPMELARLTSCPFVSDVYVRGNPFVKSHSSSYRITIFNLFRKTPGYTEDITIDSTGPSYSERKQLVDRAPEVQRVVVRPPPEDEIAALPAGDIESNAPLEQQPARLSTTHHRSRSEFTHGSQKKRKAPRRRIVELSRNQSLQQSHSDLSTVTQVPSPKANEAQTPFKERSSTMPATPTRQQSEHQPITSISQLPALTTALTPPTDAEEPSIKVQPDLDASNELYRKKIEALKQDFGNDWLSALGDDTWDAQPRSGKYNNGNLSPPVVLRPSAQTRTSSQGFVSTGRTLG